MSPTQRLFPSFAASILKATYAIGALSAGAALAGAGPTALGPPTAIPVSVGTDLGAPAATPRPEGGFWVGWDALGLDADRRGVAMVPIDAGGAGLGDLFPLNSLELGHQRELSLATSGTMVVAAWASIATNFNSPAPTVGGIYVRRLSADGTADAEIAATAGCSPTAPSNCTLFSHPRVAVAENGTTSVYWDSYFQDNHSLRRARSAATFDPTYTLSGSISFLCGPYDPLGYFYGASFGLAVANNGRAAFAYDSGPSCEPSLPDGIFLDAREADGSVAAPKVKLDQGNGGGGGVVMAKDPTGNLLVVWQRPGVGWFGRHVTVAGEPLSAQFQVGPAAAFGAAVAADGPGTYVIVTGLEAPEGGYNLVGRRIGPEGPISDPFIVNDIPIANALDGVPAVAGRDGEVLVAWRAPHGEDDEAIWVRGYSTASCIPDDETLCLGDGRFAVTGTWTDHQGNSGVAHAEPLVADSGTFWFFAPSNIELAVKVLDGTSLNQHYWVFYGALSNVAYDLEVTDLLAGRERRYHNPRGVMASIGDTSALPEVTSPASPEPNRWEFPAAGTTTAASTQSASTLALRQGRFEVSVTWRDFTGGSGAGVPIELSDESGAFWFFDPGNVELIVKVLDGAGVNGQFWVFYGALSNVEYDLVVVDTETGQRRDYHNPSRRFASVADTRAFPSP